MKTRETTPGRTYSVHTMKGCTIIAPDGWQKTIEAPDGYFDAHFGSVVIDGDDEASIKELFKLAPYQKLRLLGVVGGNAVLPAGFKRVEYLQSDGEQYIDTKREITFTTRLEYECQLIKAKTDFGAPISGSWRSVDAGGSILYMYSRIVASEYYDGRVFFAVCNSNTIRPSGVRLGDRHKVEIQNEKCYINSELFATLENVDPSDFFKPVTFYLFAAHIINSKQEDYASTFYSGRIFNVTIFDGDVKRNEFVPALDPTGTPCMYDLVSRQPFYNLGTGDFTYPTERTTYALRRVLPDWGKLTANGLRRLYHAPANYTGELYDYALEHGYKPIIEPEKPEEGYWTPRWTETEEEIVLEWIETDPPDETLT